MTFKLLTSALLTFSLAGTAFAIETRVDGKTLIFHDVSDNAWFASYVRAAVESGIVSGYRDSTGKPLGEFRPNRPVTVAEVMKMVIEAAGYDAVAYDAKRQDGRRCGPSSHWACVYFSVAAIEFSFSVDPASYDRPASRWQVSEIIADAFRRRTRDGSVINEYNDIPADLEIVNGIGVMTIDNIMVGDGRSTHCTTAVSCPKTSFRPYDPMNRAEMAKVIMTARGKYGSPNEGQTTSKELPTVFSGSEGLPLRFYDTTQGFTEPMSREKVPSACQPLYFQPSDYTEAESFTIQLKGRNVRVDRSVIDQIQGSRIEPYTLIEYTFTDTLDPNCTSKALLILYSGKHHALYTHIISTSNTAGWNFEPLTQKLLLHNIRLVNGRWQEQVRLIDTADKEDRALPLDRCAIYGVPQSDGSLIARYTTEMANAPSVYCEFDSSGNLLVKVHPVGVKGSTLFHSAVDKQRGLFFTVDAGGSVLGKEDESNNIVIAVNLRNTKEWALMNMNTHRDDPQACVFDIGSPEFDFSPFSFAHPRIRYRYKRYKTPCTGEWTWSDWMTATERSKAN